MIPAHTTIFKFKTLLTLGHYCLEIHQILRPFQVAVL